MDFWEKTDLKIVHICLVPLHLGKKGPFKLTEMDALTQISKIRPTLNQVKKSIFFKYKKGVLEVTRKNKKKFKQQEPKYS